MTDLDPAGLSELDDLIATVEEASNDTFRKDWLLLRLRYARSCAVLPADREAPGRAALPDERLREALTRANDDLVLIADEAPEDIGESIDSVRAAIKDALAAADREKPDGER